MAIAIFRPEQCYPPRKAAVWFDFLMLKPGSNYPSDEEIAQLRSHPDFPQYEKWGAIEIIEEKAEVELEAKPKSALSNLNVENALKTIEVCHEISQLESWLENEARVTIRRAINTRIGEIKGGIE